MTDERELTPPEMAREIGVSEVTVRRWLHQQMMPARRAGIIKPRWYVKRADWEAFKAAHRKGGDNAG